MIKQILVALVLVVGLSGIGNASTGGSYDWDFDGDGTLSYPNNGWISMSSYDYETSYTIGTEWLFEYNKSGGGSFTVYVQGSGSKSVGGDPYAHNNRIWGSTAGTHYPDGYTGGSSHDSYSGSFEGSCTGTWVRTHQKSYVFSTEGSYMRSAFSVYISTTPFDQYTISGSMACLENVSLYVYINNSYKYSTVNTSETFYSFDVVDGESYKLIFSDGHEYEFTVEGSNIVYNYDACSHTKYRLEESCGNLIPDSEGYYCEFADIISCKWFEESDGIVDISNSSATKIELYTDTFIGQTGWLIDPVVPNTTYTLENLNIAWGLKVIVQNESDGTLIDGAMVKVDQSCYCTDGYSTRQKLTVNGMSQFGDMSLQDASLWVMASGYKILDENSTGYSAFLSGRSNFSSKTWIVKLAPSTSNNSSSFYEPGNKVDIHFRDVNGNRTSQILDTDTEVYLYYENNNTEEEAMTLKFQSSSTHTYFIDVDSWTIPYDTIGHKTIPQADFTPWDYSYRAVIYNSSIYGWNITIPLTVRNGTKEDEQHYQNLTTNLWFMYADDGKVDYRDDMKVAIHAESNNTTLMTIDVELWKDGAYIACKNLTASNFIGADFPYYYVWDPVFDYVSGSNYSVRMYGFDRTLLETDYVECVTDDTTRKNKLTVGVKDKYGDTLNNCYIYLEDWGSLPTGTLYYNSYEGIDNGDYRYKASKSGYTGSGWDEVNLTDEDKIVWYVLSEDYTNTSTAATKFTDDDIKGFFFPLMFFLLICIVLGGLKYVAS